MANTAQRKSPFSLEELLSALPQGSRILDLGCGGGTFPYADFPALDIHAMDEGVGENVGNFPANAHFIRAGASAIPGRDSAFDLVVVNFAFEHFPDPVVALKEIERVAKDQAYAWISMPNAGSFEDQLYRNLFAGGGHLQSPTLERFLRLVYEFTCLKLITYLELPAGFTYLGESEELRHLTWAIVDALRRSVAVDARSRSGYVFILRKEAAAGGGFREYLRTCSACGSPDQARDPAGGSGVEPEGGAWTCSRCGARNAHPSTLKAIRLDEVERAQRVQWERLPETHPARLKEMLAERGRWGQDLERSLEEARRHVQDLQAECDARGRWGQDLEKELERERQVGAASLADASRLRAELEQLQTSPSLIAKLFLNRLFRRFRRPVQ